MQPDVPNSSPVNKFAVCATLIGLMLAGWWFFRERAAEAEQRALLERARAQCRIWGDKLDRDTTETGVYVRWPGPLLPEKDPWGNDLHVEYSAGGVAETVTVRSFGPDGQSHTDDDVVEQRLVVNLKGVGTGIKKNAEETARNVGKGLVKGLVDGGKEAIRGKKEDLK